MINKDGFGIKLLSKVNMPLKQRNQIHVYVHLYVVKYTDSWSDDYIGEKLTITKH